VIDLKNEVLKQEHWENTYNKMILKRGLSQDDKDMMWKIMEIYKEDIVEKIFNGTYDWSIPVKTAIAKHQSKKKRIVYIYDIADRYILGAIYRGLSSYFRNKLSTLCFSYKTDVSTSTAIRFIRDNICEDHKYGVKIDIHAYFNSVSKNRVIEMINELFSGGFKITMEKLLLDDRVMWQGEEINEWKALIPGCALGSFFANYCLCPCDRYFENKDVIYARYSDDIIIIANSKEKVKECLDIVVKQIEEYGLTLNESKHVWFEPNDNIEYLGLKLCDNGRIDISDHSKQKIKKQIHRWCRKGRMEIERDGAKFRTVAKRIIRKINNKNIFCSVHNETTFGWCAYAFRYINTIESLKEIDFYLRDTLRAMKTGRHNKNNVKAISDEEFKALGWVSLVDLYKLYCEDYDYYMEIVELLSSDKR